MTLSSKCSQIFNIRGEVNHHRINDRETISSMYYSLSEIKFHNNDIYPQKEGVTVMIKLAHSLVLAFGSTSSSQLRQWPEIMRKVV